MFTFLRKLMRRPFKGTRDDLDAEIARANAEAARFEDVDDDVDEDDAWEEEMEIARLKAEVAALHASTDRKLAQLEEEAIDEWEIEEVRRRRKKERDFRIEWKAATARGDRAARLRMLAEATAEAEVLQKLSAQRRADLALPTEEDPEESARKIAWAVRAKHDRLAVFEEERKKDLAAYDPSSEEWKRRNVRWARLIEEEMKR